MPPVIPLLKTLNNGGVGVLRGLKKKLREQWKRAGDFDPDYKSSLKCSFRAMSRAVQMWFKINVKSRLPLPDPGTARFIGRRNDGAGCTLHVYKKANLRRESKRKCRRNDSRKFAEFSHSRRHVIKSWRWLRTLLDALFAITRALWIFFFICKIRKNMSVDC